MINPEINLGEYFGSTMPPPPTPPLKGRGEDAGKRVGVRQNTAHPLFFRRNYEIRGESYVQGRIMFGTMKAWLPIVLSLRPF